MKRFKYALLLAIPLFAIIYDTALIRWLVPLTSVNVVMSILLPLSQLLRLASILVVAYLSWCGMRYLDDKGWRRA